MTAFDRARRALNFLELHRLDPSPSHYEFALAVIGAPGSALSEAVAAHTDGGLRLTVAAVQALVEQHLSPRREQTLDRRERTVMRQAQELGTLTHDAHHLTAALGRDMGAMVERAADLPAAATDFVHRLSDAERELADLRNEVVRLRDNIVPAPPPADADRDGLTQALNRSGAAGVMARADAGGLGHVAVTFSVDALDAINDRYGRAVGDNVLNAFASTLQQTFDDEELIRWSGNEFLFIIRDLTADATRLRAEQALATFAARRLRLRGSGEPIGRVTASAGIAEGAAGQQEQSLIAARAAAALAASRGGDQLEG
ncbi:diguanylate cyclase [Sphingomonas sp. BE138]|uniref:GGDEF domain-containing protein n=1 Tax=Sphingomonas sp. BE138 TaxID=2817845 RepID=UPI00285BBCDA|nr:diguanylate cyclase [Sphingomonas sp. BE138]MDR6788617.1 diguanylate cyclase [Sphingomonas sp. BE138]